MAVPAAAPVEVLRVAGMDAAYEPRQRVLATRHDDEMDVVGHPAPAEQFGLARREMESEQVLVAAPVFVGQEDVVAIVAAMGDVMRYVHRHHPRDAGHGCVSAATLARTRFVKGSVPFADEPKSAAAREKKQVAHNASSRRVFRHSPSQRVVGTALAAAIAAIVVYTGMWRDDDWLSILISATLVSSAVVTLLEVHVAQLAFGQEEMRYRRPFGRTQSRRFGDIRSIRVEKLWTAIGFSDGESLRVPHSLHFQIERFVEELEHRSGVQAVDAS